MNEDIGILNVALLRNQLIAEEHMRADPPRMVGAGQFPGGVNLFAGGITYVDADYAEPASAPDRTAKMDENYARTYIAEVLSFDEPEDYGSVSLDICGIEWVRHKPEVHFRPMPPMTLAEIQSHLASISKEFKARYLAIGVPLAPEVEPDRKATQDLSRALEGSIAAGVWNGTSFGRK